MSTGIRWGIAVIIVAGLAWLIWWSGWLTNKQGNPFGTNETATTTPTTNETQAPLNGMSVSNDASDAAISQDAAAIDAQISAYASDTSSVDSSLNDKQITQ